MKESEELKFRELQNKAEQNKEELTSIKLDTVIEGQEHSESNAVERAEYAESTADSRAYDAECFHLRIHDMWRNRLIVCNVCWAMAAVLFIWFIVDAIGESQSQTMEVKKDLQIHKGAVAKQFRKSARRAEENSEDREMFAEMIDALPPEQKSIWDHFVNMMKQDEERTIKYIEMEHKKQMKNHHGKDESVSLK